MPLNESRTQNDAGHVADHNAIAHALNNLSASASPTDLAAETSRAQAAEATNAANLTTHASDSSLHSSGQRTGYAVNNTGTLQTITTTSTAIPSTTIDLPQIARPQVLRGRVAVKCSAAMTATAGTVTTIVVTIFDETGTGLEGGTIAFDASSTSAWGTVLVELDIEANTPAHTYRLEVSRVGSTSGTFVVINNNIPGFRSALRAQAV